jgi:hypothetical protein
MVHHMKNMPITSVHQQMNGCNLIKTLKTSELTDECMDHRCIISYIILKSETQVYFKFSAMDITNVELKRKHKCLKITHAL